MYTDSEYNTSKIFLSGFLSGIVYTANQYNQGFSSDFSYSNIPDNISEYSSCVISKKTTIDKIIYNNQLLELAWPISIFLENDQDVFIASNKDLNIHGFGSSEEESLQDFNHSFVHFWHYYRDLSENKTIGYAKRLHALFKEIIKTKE